MSLYGEIFSTMIEEIKKLYKEDKNKTEVEMFMIYYYAEFIGHKIIYELERG